MKPVLKDVLPVTDVKSVRKPSSTVWKPCGDSPSFSFGSRLGSLSRKVDSKNQRENPCVPPQFNFGAPKVQTIPDESLVERDDLPPRRDRGVSFEDKPEAYSKLRLFTASSLSRDEPNASVIEVNKNIYIKGMEVSVENTSERAHMFLKVFSGRTRIFNVERVQDSGGTRRCFFNLRSSKTGGVRMCFRIPRGHHLVIPYGAVLKYYTN